MSWKPAIEIRKMEERGKAIFKEGARQIALFYTQGEVFAVDNRCPHQGFPLLKGSVDGEARLTCNWHNWKFDLKTGSCVLGADNVRSYPTRIDQGQVWIDLSDPSPEEVEAKILSDLEVGFQKRQYGRMAREVTRLVFQGRDPVRALSAALGWIHDRQEFGTTHATAVAADWIRLHDESKAEDLEARVAFLTEALDHLSHDALRHPHYPFSEDVLPWSQKVFLEAVETETEAQAIATVRGALSEGLSWWDLEGSFAAAALRHYNDFGHSLIYVQKIGELVSRLGPEVLEPLVLPLTRSLCFATREDLIPRFQKYAEARATFPPGHPPQQTPWMATSLEGRGVEACLEGVLSAARSHSPESLLEGLIRLNARNMLRFDTSYQEAYDRPTPEHVGWLDFTHALTFAEAIRTLCGRHPQLWPDALLQLACFAGRNHAFLLEEMDETPWRVQDPVAFDASVLPKILDHAQGLPIFAAHLVKTWIALRELRDHLEPDTQIACMAALNRFLHSPLKEKHVRRVTREALALVEKDFPEGPRQPT